MAATTTKAEDGARPANALPGAGAGRDRLVAAKAGRDRDPALLDDAMSPVGETTIDDTKR